ncbi:quinoprotein relay system zinc metallohydrolase 2 [Paracoccus alkanivorans]|uniref:Quinoprotein relay system zinc metallohydrolase 2 n=1 Tax=Paracoccus alkanivorans TaxID=2116655 RepID=A0A3M0MEE7_9RHOB|nr:quinoprotein relay system zinc metallohydrolase 2 [Paracoccus alkanivorans]RMC35735.1 quinoprotein relay system zinc metallohydrolase 2 [Paracoccus alkanivorans]
MFHLILTVCLAGSSEDCAPILLPQAEAGTRAECEARAGRIAESWLKGRSGLVGAGSECLPTGELTALPLQQVAPGVHVYIGDPVQMEESADGRIANLGVVIGEASVAVIDTGVSRAQGQELFAAIRRLTDLPVSHVILTHMHPDHALGTSVFKEAGAEILGHAAMPMALDIRARGYLDSITRLYPPAEVIGTEITLPDRTVADRDSIDLGGRSLSLRAEGTAHTDNDLTVFDEATATLFTGDLVFRELAPVIDGSLTGWLQWLEVAPRPVPQVIVPGHGAVTDSWAEAIGPQTEFLTALRDATREAIAAGAPMSDAVPQVTKSLQDMEDTWNSFPETAARDATAAYKELEWE